MASNTKLTKVEKIVLNMLRKVQPSVYITAKGNTTFAYKFYEDTVEVSTAISSVAELKFRAKVGEYYARQRFDNNQTIKLNYSDFDNLVLL